MQLDLVPDIPRRGPLIWQRPGPYPNMEARGAPTKTLCYSFSRTASLSCGCRLALSIFIPLSRRGLGHPRQEGTNGEVLVRSFGGC